MTVSGKKGFTSVVVVISIWLARTSGVVSTPWVFGWIVFRYEGEMGLTASVAGLTSL